MKRALVFLAAAVISTAALADGGVLLGSGARSPYLGGSGSRIDGEDDGDASRGSGLMGGGYRSGLLTGSNSSSVIGTGGRTIVLRLERIK